MQWANTPKCRGRNLNMALTKEAITKNRETFTGRGFASF
jgi:hypothetical protein